MQKCESCGMPLLKPSDFGGMNEKNKYCSHCSYPDGNLKPRHEIRENMVTYFMRMKRCERPAAEKFVDELMAAMPAWQ
jgi:hypothetical protein